MSPPINTPDGSEVSEIVLPDGSTASEVIDPDGNVVFEAGPDIPDSGLLHELDAIKLNASDGDSISTWRDEAGSLDLTAGTASTYLDDQINGNPAVVGDGSSTKLSATRSTTLAQPLEVFVVAQSNGTSDFEPVWYSTEIDATFNYRDDVRELWAGGSVLDGGSLTTNAELTTWVTDGANSIIRVNQSNVVSDADIGTGQFDGLALFTTFDDGRHFDGAISHVSVYDPTVSGYSRSDVEQYLADRFGPF